MLAYRTFATKMCGHRAENVSFILSQNVLYTFRRNRRKSRTHDMIVLLFCRYVADNT